MNFSKNNFKQKFKKNCLSAISLSLSLSLVACAPKDQKLTLGGGSKKDGGGATPFALDGKAEQAQNYKYLTVLMDRALESVHLYKAVTDAAYAEKHGMIFVEEVVNGDSIKKVTSKKEMLHEKSKLTFESTYQIQSEVDANNEVKMIHLESLGPVNSELLSKSTVASDTEVKDLKLANQFKSIEMKIDGEKVDVVWKSSDKLSKLNQTGAVLSGVQMYNELKFSFQSTAASQDGASSFLLSQFKLTHDRGVSDFVLEAKQGQQLNLILNDQCLSLNGKISLNSVGTAKYKRDLSYSESELVVTESAKTKYSLPVLKCAERDAVDLTRLF